MEKYDEEIEKIKELAKQVREKLKRIDSRAKTHLIVKDELYLDDIVARLNKPGVEIKQIHVEESDELEVQEFGGLSFTPEQMSEVRNFRKCEDYYFTIFMKYYEDDVELDVYNNLFTLLSDNPNISFDDIYDDTKDDLDEMLSENKEESDQGF